MNYELHISQLAALEILDIYDWYESQRIGLGEEFIEGLESFYSKLIENPKYYSYYQKPVRQGKLNRFPYVVVFEIIESNIVVYSVFMTSRNPDQKRTS